MPSPKSGKPGSPVAPAEPEPALEADVADPGEADKAKAAQKQSRSGKYGSEPVPPFKPADPEEEVETTWIEVLLVGEDDKPIAGQSYRITLPDGRVTEGTLDQNGLARVEGFEAGDCKVTFPDLDQDAWEEA